MKARTRIVHVALQLETGGMERLLVEFAKHADRERFDLRFVSLTTRRGTVADEIEALGWPVAALDIPQGLRPGAIWRLRDLFRRHRPDVVHTHNTKPHLLATPAARLASVPVVVQTRHGQPFGTSRRRYGAFKLLSLLTDKVVCVSADSERLTATAGVPRRRLGTILNGIDLSKFRYHGPIPDGPALCVARLSPEKGVATLIEAAALLAKRRPAFRLHIAGGGTCMGDLAGMVERHAIGANVRLLGERPDVPALLGGASLFVLPSLTEGVSLTLLEAMASGLPVVATAVGGTPEVVDDGRTGLLVPASDPAAMADAIERVLDEPDRAHAMGLAGRARVESHFDVHEMVRRYEDLYLRCLSAGY
jgi:glycosyltransferase involved in cell wall biosynthesis